MDNLRLWHKFLENIKPQVGPDNFKAFFIKTLLKSKTEDLVVLSAHSAFIKENLDQRFKVLIKQTFEKLLGKPVEIGFIVKETEGKTTETTDEDFFQPIQTNNSFLNPKFTLENFVVGPTNNVAFAAAQAVSQNPGTSYNPLFVYGGTGVGKTHLMLGIGNAILKKHPHYKVNYCSSEKFTNDYVEALQTKQFGSFRNRYRNTNILLIDDIQFFSGREGTQEEFFHTFNELSAKNSQIVITSDRPPFEIAKLEDRLKSRFQGGLMVDMQSPDFDTRVAILKNKCRDHNFLLDEGCLNLIAASVETNARDLEGRLTQLLQSLKAKNLEPTIDNIRGLLGHKSENNIKDLSPKQVLNTICDYFNIKLADLIGPKRIKELVLPRHLVMHILSLDLNLTVEKIGQILGDRDHTTVMHGRDRIKNLISTNREVQRISIELRQQLSTHLS
ncbi:chromosomal replication initiator protein DnaA [Candidatus Daviesbacteria bacterium]|nr:chromosomal replication initiator protein DnaA [Candidatus Daviesbacteria bacterium]